MSQTTHPRCHFTGSNIRHPPQWSSINASSLRSLYIELSIESCENATLSVVCRPWSTSKEEDNQTIHLEAIEFPSIAKVPGFKVSPRETSLGFRYPSDKKVK
jgi:hypothetical protein